MPDAPMEHACAPDVAMTDGVTWLDFQSGFDSSMPNGVRAWWRNAWLDALDDAALDELIAHCAEQTWFGTAADLHHMGGKFATVPEDATAFPSRSPRYWLNIYGFWSDTDDDPARVAWVKGFSEAMKPYAAPGQYLNFLGHDETAAEAKAVAVYGPQKLARLREVKRRYDPDNFFRINHNITPQ